jgi:hypothetical protein
MEAKMETTVIDEIVRKLRQLPTNLQQQVLFFVDTLRVPSSEGRQEHPLGQFSGMISKGDLALMQQAIDAGCEQVDVHEW